MKIESVSFKILVVLTLSSLVSTQFAQNSAPLFPVKRAETAETWLRDGRSAIERAKKVKPNKKKAKNVILFVGDGMGVSTLTAARILEGQMRGESGEENRLENDRAQTESATAGFAKVVTNKGKIIGATLVGEHAGELIHEFVWAMKENLKISDLNKIIRVYPTLAKITQAIGTEATLEKLRSPFTQRWIKRYLQFWR